MDAATVLSELQVIFRDILDNDDIVLYEQTNANDIEEWDSLSNIQLVVAIEKHYKLKFNTQEITSWKNIGDLIKSIIAKKVS